MFYSQINKHLLLLLLASLLAPSLVNAAVSAAPVIPNQYVLQGGRLHISYSTTGLDGQPHFSYQNGNQALNFRGDEIRTVGTEAGTLVTVTTQMTIDSGSTTLSVLIPRVNLDATQEAPIHTQAIVARHKFSLPSLFSIGQIDTYNFKGLSGTASLVDF
jgi:hypothetical protein